MSEHYDDSHPQAGVKIVDAFPELTSNLSFALERMGEQAVGSQLQRVTTIYQQVSGGANDFSFMAYALPRLTYEQRNQMSLIETRKLEIQIAKGYVTIDLDDFGQINWFHIRGISELFEPMRGAMRRS